ncbi:SURF1 family protein [Microbacteriaceae bacterium VKM Ac-2854]|nr:SURF1 family protein [Microbacteriaceae bacterium VKM Ac-2854]
MVETTVWQVARRPRWILALLLAIGIACGFAALGQWQVGRALDNAAPISDIDSEAAVPLTSIAEPSTGLTAAADGQMVTVTTRTVPGDAEILGGRLNGGASGWWVIAHTRTADDTAQPIDLVLAYGWSADQASAQAVADELNASDDAGDREVLGRLVANEGPELPADGADPQTLTTLSLAALVNRWSDVAPDVYEGYVVTAEPASGLEVIDSPERVQDVSLNWLNVFYAVEWVVFAGFALYLWFRLVKDAWERETEEAIEAATAARNS